MFQPKMAQIAISQLERLEQASAGIRGITKTLIDSDNRDQEARLGFVQQSDLHLAIAGLGDLIEGLLIAIIRPEAGG